MVEERSLDARGSTLVGCSTVVAHCNVTRVACGRENYWVGMVDV